MSTELRQSVSIIKMVGIFAFVVGLLMLVAGGATWGVVTSQLSAQNITVAEDASFLAGSQVNNPLSAYAQAQIIDEHALHATDGKTYAELGKDDPARVTAMNASFLRASLFTSVIAYGVAALVGGLGVVLMVFGLMLRRFAGVTKD